MTGIIQEQLGVLAFPLLPSEFHSRKVRIWIAGCGGTGSQVLSGLARLETCLKAVGHPGIDVMAWDSDRVSSANVGRQLFSRADIGHAKASILIHRVNLWHGLSWSAMPERLDADCLERLREYDLQQRRADILIGCVDSLAARNDLAKACGAISSLRYWLDCGNDADTGQVVLGTVNQSHAEKLENVIRLPTILDLVRSVEGEGSRIVDDDQPSCSLAESLERQSAFINQAIATVALDALWRMFRTGRIERSSWFVNMRMGLMASQSPTGPGKRVLEDSVADGEEHPLTGN